MVYIKTKEGASLWIALLATAIVAGTMTLLDAVWWVTLCVCGAVFVVVALVALMALSIPRRIVVTDEKVEIRCLLDITEIRREEIASVRRVEKRRMRWMLPLFGGCGFFGYYGHFIDLRRFDRVRLYASEWKNFVEITDIYEERLYVSCTEADKLVAQLTPPGGNRPEEEDDDPNDESDPDAEGTGADETAPAREPGLQEN